MASPMSDVVHAPTGAARRRRQQRERAIGRRVAWLSSCCCAAAGHHTGLPVLSLLDDVRRLKQDVASLVKLVRQGSDPAPQTQDEVLPAPQAAPQEPTQRGDESVAMRGPDLPKAMDVIDLRPVEVVELPASQLITHAGPVALAGSVVFQGHAHASTARDCSGSSGTVTSQSVAGSQASDVVGSMGSARRNPEAIAWLRRSTVDDLMAK